MRTIVVNLTDEQAEKLDALKELVWECALVKLSDAAYIPLLVERALRSEHRIGQTRKGGTPCAYTTPLATWCERGGIVDRAEPHGAALPMRTGIVGLRGVRRTGGRLLC